MTVPFGIGEGAALATACVWAFSCQIHSQLSRVLGPTNLTLLRLPLAVLLLVIGCLISGASMSISLQTFLFYALSGLFGVALCDWLFYSATALLGPRVACVCQSFAACITAVLGLYLLDEELGMAGAAGIGLATAGVVIVVTDGKGCADGAATSAAERRRGVILALLSALALSFGMLFAKKGLVDGGDPLFCAAVRTAVGAVILWPVAIAAGGLGSALHTLRTRGKVLFMTTAGALLGPGLGLWLSLVAIANTNTGIAATLIGLEPVLLIPVNWMVVRRRPSLQAVVGSVVAFCGTALLLLRNAL